MATNIYLGLPPPNVVKWIQDEAERKQQEMLKTPIHFVAEEPNATMSFMIGNGTYETSTTGEEGSWTPYTSNTTITLTNIGDKVYFRAGSDEGNENCTGSGFIIKNEKIAANGNIQSLLDRKMEIMDVPEGCYDSMFKGCTSLTQAPALPAETLANYCYIQMFQNCTSLTQAPALPAETLAWSCYVGMFRGCTSLTKAPELPAEKLAGCCYGDMFRGCTSLTKAPELPAEKLADECYSYMFDGCTSLTKAPELPATTLAYSCYFNMFQDCTSLTNAYYPNLGKETVTSEIVGSQDAFENAASNIEATCKDGIIIINKTT